MRDVGLESMIVGRHASDEWSRHEIPVCGDQIAGVDYEQLLQVDPTHVFLQLPEVPARLDQLARERGIFIKNYRILSLDEIRLAARELSNWNGDPVSVPHDVETRAAIDKRMDTAWSRHNTINAANVGRVLLLAQLDPAGALGPGSWHHDILTRLGATPAVTAGAPFISMDAEDILHTAPDAIILFIPRAVSAPPRNAAPSVDELQSLLGRLKLLRIPAIEHNRIFLIDDPMCQLPSTSMIGVAEKMADMLAQWSLAPPR